MHESLVIDVLICMSFTMAKIKNLLYHTTGKLGETYKALQNCCKFDHGLSVTSDQNRRKKEKKKN